MNTFMVRLGRDFARSIGVKCNGESVMVEVVRAVEVERAITDATLILKKVAEGGPMRTPWSQEASAWVVRFGARRVEEK